MWGWLKRLGRGGGMARGQVMMLMASTADVIRAEKLLKAAGVQVEVMAPPAAVRTGCDMALVFQAAVQPMVLSLVEREGLEVVGVVDARGEGLRPSEIVRRVDLGEWVMVQVGNMKLTVDKAEARVVNVSGGGCPDVPVLAARVMGRRVCEGPWPGGEPLSLCGYALARAWEEARKICCG